MNSAFRDALLTERRAQAVDVDRCLLLLFLRVDQMIDVPVVGAGQLA
jgi:hypothetical protein